LKGRQRDWRHLYIYGTVQF